MQIICKLGHVKTLFFIYFFFPLPFHVIDANIFNVKCHYCCMSYDEEFGAYPSIDPIAAPLI